MKVLNSCKVSMEEMAMRATGIVRRIDDLGRIVIPKEIRRTLRIREADPLEIFTNQEGEIMLKKYSPMGEMRHFAEQYVESLAQTSGHAALMTDRDQFIAAAGGFKKLIGKTIPKELEIKMENRTQFLAYSQDRDFISLPVDEKRMITAQAMMPIISAGDVIGMILLLEEEPKVRFGEVDMKLLHSAADFLGRMVA